MGRNVLSLLISRNLRAPCSLRVAANSPALRSRVSWFPLEPLPYSILLPQPKFVPLVAPCNSSDVFGYQSSLSFSEAASFSLFLLSVFVYTILTLLRDLSSDLHASPRTFALSTRTFNASALRGLLIWIFFPSEVPDSGTLHPGLPAIPSSLVDAPPPSVSPRPGLLHPPQILGLRLRFSLPLFFSRVFPLPPLNMSLKLSRRVTP